MLWSVTFALRAHETSQWTEIALTLKKSNSNIYAENIINFSKKYLFNAYLKNERIFHINIYQIQVDQNSNLDVRITFFDSKGNFGSLTSLMGS
jgi:hypothetical protein